MIYWEYKSEEYEQWKSSHARSEHGYEHIFEPLTRQLLGESKIQTESLEDLQMRLEDIERKTDGLCSQSLHGPLHQDNDPSKPKVEMKYGVGTPPR